MEMHKLINSSPNSSDYNDQHPDPIDENEHINQSAAHKVSFAFNRLKIDEIKANKQQSIPESDEKGENDDYVDQSAAHEVSFAFNHLKIDENERKSTPESDEKGENDDDDEVSFDFNRLKIDENEQKSTPESDEKGENDDDDEVSFAFNRLKIDENEPNKQQSKPESDETDENESRKQQFTPESPENDDENGENDDDYEEEEEEEGEFTFMCIGDDNNDSPTSSEVFENGQIRRHRQAFPLFDQSLLLSAGGDSDGERRRLPIHVPVDKVFIESPRRGSPSSTGYKSTAGGASSSATLCALPTESETGGGAPEMNMKSNSTGFSKLWRFRDKMNRSNSDGRDAFVFLEPSRTTTTTSSKTTSSAISIGKSNGGDEFDSPEKVNGVKKAKKLTASAHEVYLKQKRGGGGQTEEERRRRRSYLPYRPGLMGFFTNVNGGLSKNVHPF